MCIEEKEKKILLKIPDSYFQTKSTLEKKSTLGLWGTWDSMANVKIIDCKYQRASFLPAQERD